MSTDASARDEGDWLWTDSGSGDWVMWSIDWSASYTPEPTILDILMSKPLYTDNYEDRYLILFDPEPPKGIRKSWTGWNKLHEKVKHELIKACRCCKKNIHFRHYIQLNRWWWNEA